MFNKKFQKSGELSKYTIVGLTVCSLSMPNELMASNINHVVARSLRDNRAASDNSINNRLSQIAGVAAGDEDGEDEFDNVWIKGILGRNRQSKSEGFKGSTQGVLLGADYRISEDGIIGISYGNVSSRLKSKSNNIIERLGINSIIWSLYGNLDLTNKLYLQGMISASKSKIKTNRAVKILRKNYFGKSDFRNTSYNLSANLGYKMKLGDRGVIFVPSLGMNYGIHRDTAASETGLGVDNRSTKRNSYNSLVGVVGAKVLTSFSLTKDIKLIPEIHGGVSQDLNNKARRITTKIGVNDNYTEIRIKNKERRGFNVGTGLLTKVNEKVDINVVYDFNVRKKYKAHQGSCQIKVYF